jgi:uncharacterized membrane protein YeaQ/YmgE (transglycosylase-associated protein family)
MDSLFSSTDFQKLMEQWANDVLVWIGFGTLVGLLAKAIMPGRDPGGPIATMAMGIGGTVIGCGVLMFVANERVSPITPIGFLVATGGAFIILFFYRLLGGKIIKEGAPTQPQRVVIQAPASRRGVILRDDVLN